MKMIENKEIASSWTTILCSVIVKKLDANIQDFRTISLMRSSDFFSRCSAVILIPIWWTSLDIFICAITGTSSLPLFSRCDLH